MTTRQIGPFELQELLGKGGMGEVWLALHTTEWLPVAIKLVTLEHITQDMSSRFRASLKREAETLSQIHHAHIASILSQGELDRDVASYTAGTPYIITEYVEGFGMEALGADLPHEVTRRLLLELLDALAHVHAHGIVHRDIKPENVLVQGSPTHPRHVKLVDFGIAHLQGHALAKTSSSSSFKGLTGTPAYMAPELILNHVSDVGPWTDLYAVGCLAWQLLTGAPPFTGTNFSVIQSQIYSLPGEFSPSSPCPESIEPWLRRLLHKDPEQRFARAADAARALLTLPMPAAPLSWRGSEDSESGDGEHSEHTLVIPELKRALWRDAIDRADDAPSHQSSRTLPATWHRPRPPRQPQRMLGADISLWGIRELPMIGHDRARTMLWELVHEVTVSKRAHAVFLQGPMGTGKSRLARWLMVRAHEVGAVEVLNWTHSPGESHSEALGLMLRDHFKLHHSSRPRMIERLGTLYHKLPMPQRFIAQDPAMMARILSPASLEELSDVHPTQSIDTPTARYDVIARYLSALASKRPVLMVFDEVQWSDDALALTDHILAHTQAEFPILIVLTTRSSSRDIMRDIQARERAHAITLEPLSEAYTRELLEELLIKDERLLEQLSAYSQGIPLFAITLIREWINQGKLVPSRQGFSLAPNTHELDLSARPEHLWLQRVDAALAHLDNAPAHRTSLWLAAALGHHVDVTTWRTLCEAMQLPDPDPLLDIMRARELVVLSRDHKTWSPVSPMLRDALVAQAKAQNQWQVLNLRCADAMRASPLPHTTSHVAHHYMLAEAHEESAALWESDLEERLGHALDPSSLDEALGAWQACIHALDFGEDHPMAWRHLLWSTFASASRGDTMPETAASTIEDLQSELLPRSREHALASELLGHLFVSAQELQRATTHFQATLECLESRADHARSHRVRFELMRCLDLQAERLAARDLATQIIDADSHSRRVLHARLTCAKIDLAHLAPEAPRPPHVDVILGQWVPEARALEDRTLTAQIWTLCGDIATQHDELDQAAMHYVRAIALLSRTDDELARLEVELKRAMNQLASGEWEQADLDIRELTLEILGRQDAAHLRAPLYAAQLAAHLKRHDIHAAREALSRCTPDLSSPSHHPPAQYHIAQALLHAAELAIGLNLKELALTLLATAKIQWVSLGSMVHTQIIEQILQDLE